MPLRISRKSTTIEAEFASTRQRLAALPVPPQYAGDHQAALTNLRDIADIARRITEAAEANDQQALPALYEESARPGIALRDALSPDGRVIFSVWTPPS